MIKYVQALLWCVFIFNGLNSFSKGSSSKTSEGWCGSIAPSIEWENQLQRIIANQKQKALLNGRQEQTQTNYTIPVIVHICYWNSSQNISAAQVQSQITILNNDFAGNGYNISSIPAPFAAVKANTGISFCLAKIDPNNNILAEPGIERINAQTRGWGNPGTKGWDRSLIDGTIKPSTIWDPNFYLNIWVVPGIVSSGSGGGTILGYATFPGLTGLPGMPSGSGDPKNDGFVCRSNYFGNTGSASAQKGRTATHEIGHWLGLRHIWGDADCGTDYVNDTPTAFGPNYGCPAFPHKTCGNTTNGDMYVNFMDYTDDNCMAMFTNDQSARFQVTMQNGDFRVNLANSPVCNSTPLKPKAAFTSQKTISAPCATSQRYSFTDNSMFAPTSWKWYFQGGTPATSTQKTPTGIVFNTAGAHSVKLVVSNDIGSDSITQQIVVPIAGTTSLPLSEGFEGIFPPIGWDLVNRNGNPTINWDNIVGYSAYGIGNQCMRFDNTSLDGKMKKDDILTPKFSLTGSSSATLKFDVAYTPFYGQLTANGPNQNLWDTLEVLITSDCDITTQSIYRKGDSVLATVMPGQGDEFYPQPNQWRTETVTIPASFMNKSDLQIVFRNYGDYGHTIYVDNVNVTAVSVGPTATASFTSSDTVVCQGGSLTFTNTSTASAGSPDSVRWTIAGGTPGTSSATTTVNATFNTAGTYTISLVAYKSGNASPAATQTIRVKSNPTVGVNSPTICSGKTATLTASGATSYTWNPNIGSGATVTTPVLTANASYTVTGTKDGCVGTATANVTVTALPNVTVTSPTICSGKTATLQASGADSYTWTGGLASVSNPTTPVLTANTSYTVTGTVGSCSNTAVSNVTVTALPNVTVTSPTICSGKTATLQASGADSYTWTGGLASVSNPTTPVLTANTSYTVTGTVGSCSNTAASNVTVTALPNVTVTSPSICAGSTATIQASGADSYTWSPNIGSGATVTTPVLTANASYTVTGTVGNCSNTAVSNVIVNTAAPTVTISATPSSASVCQGESIQLTGNGANNYSWSSSQTGTTTGSTLTFTPTSTITVNVSGTVTGCSTAGTSSINITVTPKPTVTVDAVSPICGGQTATLQAHGADSYTWTGGLASVSNPTTPVLNANASYTVTGTTNGCSNSAIVNVSVTPKPTVTVDAVSPICSGETATLQAHGADSYTWTGGLASVSNPTTPVLTSTTSYTVTGTTNNCSNTAIANVTVTTTPVMPSITQSGDTLHSSSILVGAAYEWYKGGILQATTSTPYYILTAAGTYTVKVKNGNCSSESAPYAAIYTGVKNASNSVSVFEVYPNPTEGKLKLNISLTKNAAVQLRMYSPDGRELYGQSYTNIRVLNEELNLQDVAKGVYILRLNVDDEVYYHKVVKQ